MRSFSGDLRNNNTLFSYYLTFNFFLQCIVLAYLYKNQPVLMCSVKLRNLNTKLDSNRT